MVRNQKSKAAPRSKTSKASPKVAPKRTEISVSYGRLIHVAVFSYGEETSYCVTNCGESFDLNDLAPDPKWRRGKLVERKPNCLMCLGAADV